MARDPFQRTGIDNQKKKINQTNNDNKNQERSLSTEIPRVEDQMK